MAYPRIGSRRQVVAALGAAVILAVSQSASAIPVLWTLQGVTFDDGGTAVGSFVYDATTNVYSSVAVTTTDGSAMNGRSYNYALLSNTDPGLYSPQVIGLSETTDMAFSDPYLLLFFGLSAPATGLTDAGGTVVINKTLYSSGEGGCTNNPVPGKFCNEQLQIRDISAGSVFGTPEAPAVIPVPAAVWLFGSALGLMGVMRRKISG